MSDGPGPRPPALPITVAVDLVGPGSLLRVSVVDEVAVRPRPTGDVPTEVTAEVETDTVGVVDHETGTEDDEGLGEGVVSVQTVVDEVLAVTTAVRSPRNPFDPPRRGDSAPSLFPPLYGH